MRYIPNFPNRTLCDVLEEMRNCVKTNNFSYLPGLIEEAQTMGNRMEASLRDQKDLREIREQISEASKELKTLDAKIKEKNEKNNNESA